MNVFLIFLMTLCSGLAEYLISSDQLEVVFEKYLRNAELSPSEYKLQEDIFEILRRPTYVTSKTEYQSEVRSSLDCLLCRSAFSALFQLVKDGASDEDLTQAIANICTLLNIESENVCSGVIDLNLHIITYIIRNTPEATSRNFCGLVLQKVGNPNFCTNDDPRFEWQVELPEQIEDEVPSISDGSPLTIAIITDTHIDPLYEPFGVADCGEPTCCRKGQTISQSYTYTPIANDVDVQDIVVFNRDDILLNMSAVPKMKEIRSKYRTRFQTSRNVAPAGYWGDYRNCDTPKWAFDDVIDRMASSHQFDVVYYIGDTIDHFVWETTYDMINETNLYLIEKMRQSFGDNVLIVPTIGNHESQPTNQFAPPTVTAPKLNTTWLYEALLNKWDYYLTNEAKATFRVRGDFSRLVKPGLRVISLNTNMAYKYNWWLVYDPLEPKRHLDWLVQELYKAELAGEKVHILTHIPPGVHDFPYVWTREYNRIVNRFSSTIAAEFNGHVHSDEFKIFYSLSDGRPINVAWGGGGATAYSNYNLNYKIATFDPSTFEPQNIVNYVYNLTEANLTPDRRPHWFQLYDMKNDFAISNLNPETMDRLVHRMVTTNTNLLDLYSAYYSKLSDTRWPFCNSECKLDNLCKIVTTVLWQREKCEELRKEFYSKHKA
ncbi:unnamed protein product [Parnassius apollo]|uniref:Sphingomyelin phosphodiesterase n=1 Tax=Parnassius apollo TaxID=110799 RepID=A0A8S3X4J2_PARAO|nr:unnamed protein product [Parnassius apollo]